MPRRKLSPESLRPYATYYYAGERDKDAAFSTHGRCASDANAVGNSSKRIFSGQYGKCIIFDVELGIPIYTIWRDELGCIKMSLGNAFEREQVVETLKLVTRRA